MNVFKTQNHREILRGLVAKTRGGEGRPLTFSDLADAIRVQKTYVSRVMAEGACWSADQAFVIADFFSLSEDESNYFFLLVELERTALPKRKAQLLAKVKAYRQQYLRSEKSLPEAKKVDPSTEASLSAEYFSDPYHSLLHVYSTLPKFRKNVSGIAGELGISAEYLRSLLSRLECLGVLSYDAAKNTVELKETQVHSPGGSPLVFAHQQMFRALAVDRMHRCPSSRRNNFNVAFAAEPAVQEAIWAEFLGFLKRTQELAKGSSAKEVLYLQFDLFPWASKSVE